ncbi:MAG: hypothetical protein Q9219_000703 [cf. Caloplaca sp. 3 TL-2023]
MFTRRAKISSVGPAQVHRPELYHDLPEYPLPNTQPSPDPPSRSDAPRASRLKDVKPFSEFLTDNYHRQHTYLRISVTERCNLRCTYCMPAEGVALSPPAHLLTTPEIVHLSQLFVKEGVNKIRLTGGEPTVRKDILPLMHEIGNLRNKGLKELCLTTNGISLHRKLDAMVDAGLTGVNLSLDTLDPHQFQIMTRRKGFDAVMKSLDRLLDMNRLGAGIKLKLNTVIMRGINERELIPFVEMGRENDVEVRFIEYMPFDGNKWSRQKMLSYKEMVEIIRQKYPDLSRVREEGRNETSKTWHVPGFKGKVGFITSMTENFCGTCNRLRITSDGNLKVCLFGNSEVSLRDLLREEHNGEPLDWAAVDAMKQIDMGRRQNLGGSPGPLSNAERERRLLEVIGMAVKRKKERHAGMEQLEHMKNRPMILIEVNAQAPSSHDIFGSLEAGTPKVHTQKLRISREYQLPVTSLLHRSSPQSALALPSSFVPPQNLGGHYQSAALFHTSGSLYGKTKKKKDKYNSKSKDKSKGKKKGKSKSESNDEPSQPNEERYPLREPYRPGFRRLEGLHHLDPSPPTTPPPSSHPTTPPPSSSPLLTSSSSLPHLTPTSEVHQIPITAKPSTVRTAIATGHVRFSTSTLAPLIEKHALEKGDVLAVARVAGIMAVKNTSALIPLAHNCVPVHGCTVDLELVKPSLSFPEDNDDDRHENIGPPTPNSGGGGGKGGSGGITIRVRVESEGKTGVEMEALAGVVGAALSVG